MTMKCYTKCNKDAITTLAHTLAAHATAGDCIALSGDLGAGKTFFAQAFIRSICGEVEVTSPTYMLVQHYFPPNAPPIAHYDLYRLKHEAEIEETGLAETLCTHINLIEWPDIAVSYLPPDTLHIVFAFNAALKYRDLVITGNDTWMTRLPPQLLPSL
jgi:tRNA threonylcarbamoyl adenosine modification protein YjeE